MHYESIESFNKALELAPKNIDIKYYAFLSEGRHLVKKGNLRSMWTAIEKLSNASIVKPNEVEPLYFTGLAYEKKDKKDYDGPIPYYSKAVELGPKSEFGILAAKKIKELKDTKAKMEKFLKKKKGGGK